MPPPKRNGFEQPLLNMFSAHQQRLTRGAPNASRTNIRIEGRFDAMNELLSGVFQLVRERPMPEVTEIENLNPITITDTLNRRLLGQPELSEPTSELSDLVIFHETVKQLRSGKPSRLLREAQEFAAHSTSEAFSAVATEIDAAASDAPFQIAQLRQYVGNIFDNLEVPQPSNRSASVLRKAIGGISFIRNLGTRMAESARQFVIGQLSEHAKQAAANVVSEFAGELVGEQFRSVMESQRLRIEELAERFADLPQKMIEIEGHLAAKCDDARKRNVYVDTSVFLPLPGPSRDEVTTELIKRHNLREQSRAGWLVPAGVSGSVARTGAN